MEVCDNEYMKTYKTGEFAELIGVSQKTLIRWDKSGRLHAFRTPGDHRYYTEEQYLACLNKTPEIPRRSSVIYSRVSTRKQKVDLKNQTEYIRSYVNGTGVIPDEIIEETGLNYKRKKWNELLDRVMNNEIDTIYIAHKDRFVRFGYEWFESLCSRFNTKIVVLNNENLSPEAEMAEDLISIIHDFSCRLYGLRKYKKKTAEDVLSLKEEQKH